MCVGKAEPACGRLAKSETTQTQKGQMQEAMEGRQAAQDGICSACFPAQSLRDQPFGSIALCDQNHTSPQYRVPRCTLLCGAKMWFAPWFAPQGRVGGCRILKGSGVPSPWMEGSVLGSSQGQTVLSSPQDPSNQ